MLRSKILSLSNNFHFYAILITLLGLSFSSLYFLLVLIPYLFYLRHLRLLTIKTLIFLIGFTIVYLFLLLYRPIFNNLFKGVIVEANFYDEYNSYVLKDGLKKILIYTKSSEIYKVGDVLEIEGAMKSVSFKEYGLYLKSKGVFNTCTTTKITYISHKVNILAIRSSILEMYQKRMDETSFKYFASLIFAYDTFGDDFKTSLNSLSLSHLFSISGYHITILTLIILKILAKNMKLYEKRNYIVICFLIIYSFLCANAYGVVRSVLMYILTEVNFKKQYNLTKLDICSISYLFLIITNPLAIFRLSFKLTYIVTFFIILSSNLLKDKNMLKKNYKLTLLAFLATIPLVSNINNSLNLLTILVSPLFVLLFGFVIMPITYLLVLLPGLYVFTSKIYELFTLMVSGIDTIQIFKFAINSFSPSLIIIYYLFLFFILIKLDNKALKKVHIILFFLFLITFINVNTLTPYDEVIMLDVGQGDSFLIKRKHGKGNILVDSYGSNIEGIKKLGVEEIDTLIITHADNDHMETAGEVIDIFNCDRLVTSGYDNSVETLALRKKVNYDLRVKGGEYLNIEGLRLNFLAPLIDLGSTNSNSLVFTFKIRETSFLFTGDMDEAEEKTIVQNYKFINVDILKVPHHGAKTSLSEEFLAILKFKVALISVKEGNFYGHPDKEILKKLAGYKIYRTDKMGPVRIRLFKHKYKIYYNEQLNPIFYFYE